MDKTTLAITIVTLGAFVAAGLAMLTTMRKIVWPEGKRYSMRWNGIDVHVIFESGAQLVSPNVSYALTQLQVLAYSRMAVLACVRAWPKWREKSGAIAETFQEAVPALVLNFVKQPWHCLEGYQTYAKARIGPAHVPMAVIKSVHVPHHQADPLIGHEVAHMVGCYLFGIPDRDETSVHLWAPVGGATSFESMQAAEYATIVSQYRTRLSEFRENGEQA